MDISKEKALSLLSSMRTEEQRLLNSVNFNDSRYFQLNGSRSKKGDRSDQIEQCHKKDLSNTNYDALESIREIMAHFCELIDIEYQDKDLNNITKQG